jgi:hypothetical protein
MLSKGREGRGARGERLAVQVGAFLSGRVTKPVRPRPGVWEQPALPGSARRGCCPDGKMIDCVSPPAGMRPLSLIRPPAWPLLRAQRPAAADSGSAGAGRGVPTQARDAVVHGHHGTGRSSGGGERVVAGFGQDGAGLPEDLARLRQGGTLTVLALLDSGVGELELGVNVPPIGIGAWVSCRTRRNGCLAAGRASTRSPRPRRRSALAR